MYNTTHIEQFLKTKGYTNFVEILTKYELQNIITTDAGTGDENLIKTTQSYLRKSQATSALDKGIEYGKEQETKKLIAYTGDIGNPLVDNKFVGKLEKIENCDILISEVTYGDRKELKVREKERNNDIFKVF